jgi:hypothetical protein
MPAQIGFISPFDVVRLDLSPASVVPGQPVNMFWSYNTFAPLPSDLTATAKLRLGQTILYSFDPVPVTSETSFGHTVMGFSGHGTLQISPTDSGGKDLYAFGAKSLDLIVTFARPTPGGGWPTQLTGSCGLSVVGESVDASWWTWDSPLGPSSVNWGSAYSVVGTLKNKSEWVELSAALLLNELDDNGQAIQRGSTNVSLGVGNSYVSSFPSITWNNTTWPWVIPSGILVGPSVRLFVYTALITLQDTYGNIYPQSVSTPLGVVVAIPLSKDAAAALCMWFSGTAIGLLACAAAAAAGIITAPAAAYFTAAAAIATAAAATAYAVAADPVAPDPSFRVPVDVLPPPPPPPNSSGQDLYEFFGQCLKAMRAITAFPVAQARVVAARDAGDSQALADQQATARAMVTNAEQAITAAAGLISGAASALSEVDHGTWDALLRQACIEGTLPGLDETMAKAGLSPNQQQILLSRLRPDLSVPIPTEGTLAMMVSQMAVIVSATEQTI